MKFWEKVAKPNERGCRLWRGVVQKSNGYGYVYDKGRRRRVHRVAYELLHGPIPEGLVVRHTCDVKLCVEHLVLGTHADNERDALERDRKPRGERIGNSKLTAKAVRAIRKSAKTQVALAKEYGVTQANISSILTGKTWKHVGE